MCGTVGYCQDVIEGEEIADSGVEIETDGMTRESRCGNLNTWKKKARLGGYQVDASKSKGQNQGNRVDDVGDGDGSKEVRAIQQWVQLSCPGMR